LTYPATLDTYPSVVDEDTPCTASLFLAAYNAAQRVQTELGTDPAGSATDVKTRLVKSLSPAGFLSFINATTLTISAGSVTPTQNFHVIGNQGAAASDDLDTITAPAAGENWLVTIRPLSSAQNVVLKHGTGNLALPGGKDYTLDLITDVAFCIYDQVQSLWLVLIPGALPAGSNVWTGYNYFNSGTAGKVTTIIANLTLDNTYRSVRVDSTSGNITVTLPAAATYPGIEYWIRKIVAANTVTIDGDGAETIDGAATRALTTQWQTVHIQSNGVSWDILGTV
jgi:hypothetical protein